MEDGPAAGPVNAMTSAFIPFDERLAMINEVVKPGYAELESEWLFRQTAPTSGSARSEGRPPQGGRRGKRV